MKILYTLIASLFLIGAVSADVSAIVPSQKKPVPKLPPPHTHPHHPPHHHPYRPGFGRPIVVPPVLGLAPYGFYYDAFGRVTPLGFRRDIFGNLVPITGYVAPGFGFGGFRFPW